MVDSDKTTHPASEDLVLLISAIFTVLFSFTAVIATFVGFTYALYVGALEIAAVALAIRLFVRYFNRADGAVRETTQRRYWSNVLSYTTALGLFYYLQPDHTMLSIVSFGIPLLCYVLVTGPLTSLNKRHSNAERVKNAPTDH